MAKPITSFDELLKATLGLSKQYGVIKLAVVCADDRNLLEAINEVTKNGVIEALLIGDKEQIVACCREKDISPDEFEIIDQADNKLAAEQAVQFVRDGRADFLMKGNLPTGLMMKAVLDNDKGLRVNRFLSHVTVLEPPDYHKFLLMSDSGVNINPGTKEKVEITKNAVEVAHLLGIKKPRVALIAVSEKISPKMPATVEAADVVEILKREKYNDAFVEGPMALDVAISEHGAEVKGLTGEVPGHADIIVFDNIEVGNAVYKALVYFSSTKHAGVVCGAKAPILVDSRSVSRHVKFHSIVLGAYIMHRQKEAGK